MPNRNRLLSRTPIDSPSAESADNNFDFHFLLRYLQLYVESVGGPFPAISWGASGGSNANG
ncbi:hypothetical protein CFAM422_005164 [Trichoderma lentiforme]|uniref:Uncharacterized protein n=1 Tax=Trichoderma lentiforme TaxID=1567552 RepID=A0A9P5CFU4_9HYPO|nr:hypothetical protein CFAM422_005164 [Trichoderma lentiforme]